MQEVQESSIEQMIDYILKYPIQPPKTYSFSFDIANCDPAEKEKAHVQFLNDIFFYAMKKKYGYSDILELKKDEFEELNNYMKSLGFKYIVTSGDSFEDPWEVSSTENKKLNISIQLL